MERSRFDIMDDLRAGAAFAAVAVAVLICTYQHHFLLTGTLASLHLMLRHRCGKLMFLVTLWALSEVLVAFTRAANRIRYNAYA